ncbi:MAG TPA: HypC/HybG/HupF family hydrogenase formation chaperone [Euryarchaeota archaeon]|nr:HypC/HybG/HupF family hydrogenase formation chaperone [Euryarchaeota archaeon]
MCLAIPAKVLEVEGDRAKVDYGGVVREVNVSLIEKPQLGQYVIVHAGYAIQVMDAAEAEETLDLFRQILEFEDSGDERIDA